MATPIVMPKLGNTVEECLLASWKKDVGDSVEVGDVIAEIETDKTMAEVEATAAGTLLARFWEEGDLVPVLLNLCAVGETGEDASALRPAEAGDSAEEAPSEPPAEEPAAGIAGSANVPAADAQQVAAAVLPAGDGEQAPLSPRARRYVAEHPVPVLPATGSGPGGRVLEADVQAAFESGPRLSPVAAALHAQGVAAPSAGSGVSGMIRADDMGKAAPEAPHTAAPAAPVAPVAPVAPPAGAPDTITETKLSNLRRIIAGRLHDSLSEMAQYTLNAEVDVTALLALRQRIKAQREPLGAANVNLGDMILFATVKALLRHPEINAEFTDNVIRSHSAVHLGFACDTPRGLTVPVIRDAHALSLGQLSGQVKVLAREAIAGTLNPDLLSGGTFTVSNLGVFGVTSFTPVINAPQVGILGVGATGLRPVRRGDSVEYRDMMHLSLTLDHRVVDGAPGARFLATLIQLVENFDVVVAAG